MKINQITENMSYTAKRIHDIEKEKGVTPGTPDWFKLWFSLPYLKESLSVTEALDNPYPYTWELEQEDYQVAAAPLPNDSGLDVTFDNTDNNWFIDFSVDFSQDKTGAGDEFRIFATVVAVIKDWWKNKFDKKADSIVWSGSKREEEGNSRVKLYKRFAQQMASQTGWKLEITDGGSADLFKLSNPNPTPREESINEGYKLQLERDKEMLVLNITDTASGKRTEVRGKPGYETGNYDPNDKLHMLLDKIGKSADISQLMNGEPVGINPKHPQGASAKDATDTAFNEKITKRTPMGDVIDDFYQSDAPQFKGKSKKKRRQMAIAAKLAKMDENFADGKVKGKSRPGRVKRSGASCNGSVTELRAKAKKASGEKAKMYHWCANMKAGKKK